MPKAVRSWSKPDGNPTLIGRKQVDKSLFIYGSHIPHEFRVDFTQANGGYELSLGESKSVTLILGNTEYEAVLRHALRKDSGGGRLELRYDNSRGLRKLLRSRFPVSYEYLQVEAGPEDEVDREPENIPQNLREYLDFHETGIPFRYRLETVSAQADLALVHPTAPPSFEQVWSDLHSVVANRDTVHTLAKGVPNQVRWIESKGIQVATDQGVEVLPRGLFEQSWQTLVQMGPVAADALPGEARFRSTAICALLAQLPYVDYTTYPRTTLFLTSHTFTHSQLAETFKVGVQGGIRHSGSAESPRLVVFITGDPTKPDSDHPYHDRWEGETFYYCGEGLEGDQTMTRGNRALRSNLDSEFPVYGFQKNLKGAYSYMGRFKVLNVLEDQQEDTRHQRRQVYIFEMRRIPVGSPPVIVTPDESAKPPEVTTETTRPLMFLRVAAPTETSMWSECLAGGYLCIAGGDQLGDLRTYSSSEDLFQTLAREYSAEYGSLPSLAKRRSSEFSLLRNLAPGDHVVATYGPSTILALGTVVPPGYAWRPDRNTAKHTITVQWDTTVAKRIQRQQSWAGETISKVPAELRAAILEPSGFQTPARADLSAICAQFGASLLASGIRFGPRHSDVVRSFIASLATKRLAILTGLSGSGKTQIGLRFGQWLGNERYKLVSVRPDWTGSEALFGYPNALIPVVEGRSTWHVPGALEFMLSAHNDPNYPYVLVLDEMNLAHVERYFADFLSGMESGEPCLPNLRKEPDGNWRLVAGSVNELPIPENLFVVGTVNVDETTYMFSPKVLDRANTFEFRVRTDDLSDAVRKPLQCEPGDTGLVRGFLAIAADDEWQQHHPAPKLDQYLGWLHLLHRVLADGGFEFGHRVYYEAIRYAAILAGCGDDTPENALDQQVMQKVLPRLHGTRRRLEGTLCALGQFCFDLTHPDTTSPTSRFNPERPPQGQQPRLPLSFDKLQRMTRTLRTNQFTSFTE